MGLRVKYILVGMLIGLCLSASFAWAYQMVVLVDGNGNTWGSAASPLVTTSP